MLASALSLQSAYDCMYAFHDFPWISSWSTMLGTSIVVSLSAVTPFVEPDVDAM